MGGVVLGYIPLPSIKAFLEMGLSQSSFTVPVYVNLIRSIDKRYVKFKQDKINDAAKKDSDKSKRTGRRRK